MVLALVTESAESIGQFEFQSWYRTWTKIIVFGHTPIYSNIAIQLSTYVVHTEFKWVAKNDPALSELTSPLCAL